MLDLLIESGFNENKYINKSINSDNSGRKSIFVILCCNGSFECLTYLLSLITKDAKKNTETNNNSNITTITNTNINDNTYKNTNADVDSTDTQSQTQRNRYILYRKSRF